MRQTVEADSRGTAQVDVGEDVSYLIIKLPDGTTLDVSISPRNKNNHIKMYDDNGYAVMAMDSGSQVRPLEVWNGPVTRSTRRGTEPGPTKLVEPFEEAGDDEAEIID